jgi:chemotaxis protein methyltransferase CheR
MMAVEEYQYNTSKKEVRELLEKINIQYNNDLTQYSFESIKRRVNWVQCKYGIEKFAELLDKILDDESFYKQFVEDMMVHYTEMFRDPKFFLALKKHVLPMLATYPKFKIWHAGCSTGEEVYSIAILLKEAGLLERSIQYATDVSAVALEEASEGTYSLKYLKSYESNYLDSGGEKCLSDYYERANEEIVIKPFLKKNLVFAKHNLVVDQSFNEFQLIICRNVLIYFERNLQENVLGLFYNSLSTYGYLALGSKETIRLSVVNYKFQGVSEKQKIWRKTM